MKKFETVSRFNNVKHFTEEMPPSWLICRENKWFYDKHVLTLKVGKSIESEFHKITRIE